MSAKEDIETYLNLGIDIDRINKKISEDRKRLSQIHKERAKIKERIGTYLVETNQPAVRHGDWVISRTEGPTPYKVRKMIKQEAEGMSILQKHGIDDASDIMHEVVQALEGSSIKKSTVRFETSKQYLKRMAKSEPKSNDL